MYPLSFIHSFYQFEKKYNDNPTQPQIAELIEAGCTFKSDAIINKNKTKQKGEEKREKTKKKQISTQLQ